MGQSRVGATFARSLTLSVAIALTAWAVFASPSGTDVVIGAPTTDGARIAGAPAEQTSDLARDAHAPTTTSLPTAAVASAVSERATTSTSTTTTTTTAPTTTTVTTTVAPPAEPDEAILAAVADASSGGADLSLPAIGGRSTATYIAPTAPTDIPVYDTAWQMFGRATPEQADAYFAALAEQGFSGTWSGIIHHAPTTWNAGYAGGERIGDLVDGQLVLRRDYVAHVRSILDAAHRHGMKVGIVAAWQNLYLPGGGADAGIPSSDEVRGSITVGNARAWGRHLADDFGGHPALSMWVFGGDAGTNNTEDNKAVWREMAVGVRDGGSIHAITYHTPTSEFDQLNYVGEPWLDFIAPETGHAQDAATTGAELAIAKDAYGLPVWQGEPRYHDIDVTWIPAEYRRPGTAEMEADALAARTAGVSGYVYGDAGRWTWCSGYGDGSPCSADDIAASFGDAEAAVIAVFSG